MSLIATGVASVVRLRRTGRRSAGAAFIVLLGASAAWAQQGVIDYTGGFATHTTVTGNGSTTFAPAGAPTADFNQSSNC